MTWIDLDTQVNSLKSALEKDKVDALSLEVQKLSKSLTDATGSLPAHVQRGFELVGLRFLPWVPRNLITASASQWS
jgi:hypothetical protein